jgi:CRP-like cAMP-binding protein
MSDKADYQSICNSTLGQELSESDCQELAGIMGIRQLNDGDTLVTEGDSDTALFLLVTGKLAVYSKIEENDTLVYTMKKGECSGTRAFVDRTPRKATLRAVGETTVYTLDPEPFEQLLDTNPHVVYKVMRAIFRITHSNLMRMNTETRQLSNYITKSGGRY